MDDVKVSIVVPVYNAEKNIRKCIESILRQSYTEFELILLNDGSTDHTLDILKEYQAQDKRIRLIDKSNEGVSMTRNRGISEAVGQYLMFIDNDDYIRDDYVVTFVEAIESSQSDIVVGGYKRVDDSERILFQQNLHDNAWAKFTVISPWAKIYRTEYIKKNNIEFFPYPIGEDIVFNLRAYSCTERVSTVSYNGYYWYYEKTSISNTLHTKISKNLDILLLADKVLSEMNPKYLRDNKSIVGFFFRKFFIWWLLYAGKNSSPRLFISEYERLNNWLYTQKFSTHYFMFWKYLNEERLSTKISLWGFHLLEKLHLLPLFAKLYCKGKE